MKAFGELLRDFRQRRKMTQQEMADRLGLSSPYIAQMESGFKPPPPQPLVEKIAVLLQLRFDEKRLFSEAAEKQRELQSLVKATRKVGYVLAGNKVCVPQKAIAYRIQQEIDDLVDSVPHSTSFAVDRIKIPGGMKILRSSTGELTNLRSRDDLRSWALTQIGDQPPVWLAFLGKLYGLLLLTPDERLLCRQPLDRREDIVQHGEDVGTFFSLLHQTIDESKDSVIEQILPDVIAPHEAWRNMDDLMGEPPQSMVETLPPQKEGGDNIRHIPIIGVIQTGSDEFEHESGLGYLGLPKDWFHPEHDYEACLVKSEAYVPLGVWPGCKAVYEIEGALENEDLVVVQLGDRLCLRKFFDLGDQILLQGGPLSRPIRVDKDHSSVRVVGVVRELISRFKEMR